jgi:pimeloyl-ACP methyl ester carboxylesterase
MSLSKRATAVVLALAMLFSFGVTFGQMTPTALAQDGTPVAVAPPQDLLPAAELEVEGQTAEINGIDIYYEVYGEGNGSPVILLHSGLSNGDHFVNQIPALAEDHEVIVMDSRGHGRSSLDDTPISYEVMAADVLGLLDHLEIEKADLVGWSDGGIIGLEIAIHNPDRLNKVVAYGANFDPSGVRPDVAENAYFNAFVERAAEEYQELSPEPERWDEFLTNISNMWATQPNYTEEQLGSITTPILVLDGEEEEAIDINHTELMASLIPGSDLILMPDTGHFALLEQPEEFNQIVLDYLG